MVGNTGSSSADGLCIYNIVINSAIRDEENHLNVCHLNACSLFKKMSRLKQFLMNSKMHVICISETWFTNDISNQMVEFCGYRIIRNDRHDGCSRGDFY